MFKSPKSWLADGAMVQEIVERLKECEGNYLEIGCFEGHTLKRVAKAVPERICYGIDPFLGDRFVAPAEVEKENTQFIPMPEQKQNLYQNIKELNNISFHETTAEEFLSSHADEELSGLNISVVFIDGSHHYEYVSIDWKLALKVIGPKKGCVLFDDFGVEDVRTAFHECAAHLEKEEYGYVASAPPATSTRSERIATIKVNV